ncbi:glycosyltransferase [Flavobacterium sp. UMI-01]|uniref:glycosyltransferase n=1 Tax=Flavobacterium sp. UMI-01 TaxID=1441053 RepID=UPI001C7D1CC2|nr:glycosyltransferase [Flavobacterium sp. UMI-01]GIZ07432.1 glycosyl transferase [Flavobacterium sp. UMI-01]
MYSSKKKVVISAINLFEGGTLSVLKDCLHTIEHSMLPNDYDFIALVHKKDLFVDDGFNKIQFFEFPKSRKSYLYRLYYEYYYFKPFTKKHEVDFWFSLHDISPNIGSIPQAVYCHNPSPFNKVDLKNLFVQPTVFLFSLFYRYLYKINIKKNKYVVVQQLWIKNEFARIFKLNPNKIVVAKPQEPLLAIGGKNNVRLSDDTIFIFPTFPRTFKNIEIIGEAVKILNEEGINNFSVIVTIDGSENSYSKQIFNKYRTLNSMKFIGLQTRAKIVELYEKSDCLIFPSKLETWGLPISEYKQFLKPMLVANMSYAKETVGNYDKVKFFDPEKPNMLSKYMKQLILKGTLNFDETKIINYPKPYAQNWDELFELLLK